MKEGSGTGAAPLFVSDERNTVLSIRLKEWCELGMFRPDGLDSDRIVCEKVIRAAWPNFSVLSWRTAKLFRKNSPKMRDEPA